MQLTFGCCFARSKRGVIKLFAICGNVKKGCESKLLLLDTFFISKIFIFIVSGTSVDKMIVFKPLIDFGHYL